MNGTTLRTGGLILLVLVAIVLYSAVFIVQQTQYALVLRFGAVQSAISEPGLKFKLPLVDAVTYFEKRVLDLDLPVQTILSADRQNLEVDAFTRYRIIDPLRFYQAVGNIALANQRLQSFTNSAMRNTLASASRDAIVRTERADLMNRIQADVNRQAASLGIVQAVTMLAQTLGVSVIAEGVEHEQQVDFLRLLGCNEGQGFLFGRPVAANKIRHMLSRPDLEGARSSQSAA